MELKAGEMFDPKLLFANVEFDNKEDLLRYMATKMYDLGYVKETYIQAVIDREEIHPTGLKTEFYGVAIPHTDAIHVNKPIIALSILEEEVIFKEMGDADGEDINTKFVFMLSIDDPNKHVDVLSKLSTLFQSGDIMNTLLGLDVKELYEKLNHYVN